MKIAHVSATFPPYRGGTGNVCYHNARQLALLGHEVHVFTAAHPDVPANEKRDRFCIHRLTPFIRHGNAPLLPQLMWQLRGFDLIHLHYPFYGGEITALAAKLHDIPLVVTYHQDVFLSGVKGIIEQLLRHSVGRFTLQTADRVLFTSEDYGQASYVRPMLEGREHTIGELPNGVDTTRFFPCSPSLDFSARYGLASDDQVMLLVAGLDQAHYFKGVNLFLEALTMLPSTVKGVIVGDGDLRASYEATANTLGLSKRVFFAGRVSETELPEYYRLADATVLPSITMGEAFGLVLLESLASCTPVIASNIPGVRTVVDDGQDGFLVPPKNPQALADAMKGLLADEHKRRKMGQQGRLKVEARYDWRQIGRQLVHTYKMLCSASHRSFVQEAI